ncbi:MAG: hypothetical protein ABF459_12660 [Gluconobacter cerinus]|nr:hypothetical protein [Gluconobacter cerinus]
MHRREIRGHSTLLIEVQSGPYLDEDDIVRIKRSYART